MGAQPDMGVMNVATGKKLHLNKEVWRFYEFLKNVYYFLF